MNENLNYVDVVKGSFKQTREQFENMCKIFVPNAIFKDEGSCGYICYRGNTEVTSAEVALLSENKWAVYDKWRDCTITDDFDYVFNFLKRYTRKMTAEEFEKKLEEYRHAKYDIVEDFDCELYDCFEDLAPLENDTFEHFDYYWYDDEWTACSDLKDNACYINVPGYIVKMWFEGKKEEAKEALKKAQKNNLRYHIRRE